MIQEIVVWVLFALAFGYLIRLLYQTFKPGKSGCAKGCGSCALDIKKLEAELKQAEQRMG